MVAWVRRGLRTVFTAAALVASLQSGAGTAAELRIGVAGLPTSADPHVGANRLAYLLTDQIYQSLAGTDQYLRPYPQLAERWERTPEGDWTFHLRPGVAFHDGRPFTARDVVYSFCRTAKVEAGNRPFAARLAGVAAVETPDPMRVLIRMTTKRVVFPIDIATIPIVAAPDGESPAYAPTGCAGSDWLDSRRFDAMELHVGTGPFRLTAFGDRAMVMVRHEGYWGPPPDWSKLALVASPGAEGIKALLDGRVDIVDTPPVESLPFLAAREDVAIVTGPTSLLYYLQANQDPQARPATAPGEGPRNPFADADVRRAVSLALPRQTIISRVVQGFGSATGQMVLPGGEGYAPDIAVDPYDPQTARRLLTEAGYPDGMQTELLCQRSQIRMAEIIAHFLQAVGIRATVVAEKPERYWQRLRSGDYGLFYGGWSFTPSDPADALMAVLGPTTPDAPGAVARGAHNYGRYDGPVLADLLRQAAETEDFAARHALGQQAQRLAAQDAAWIPIMHLHGRWAVRKGLVLRPRLDRLLLAADIGRVRTGAKP